MTTHFAFGENWASYAEGVSETQVAWSQRCMQSLLGEGWVGGKSVVDVGSGSGLHSAAALSLGAASVLALDRDPASVATTRAVLARFAPEGTRYEVREADILALDASAIGQFDLVYSWGVLHHTGAMVRAIERAASLTAPGGRFAFALYRKTWLCPLWKIEKRFYSHASKATQARMRDAYVALYRLRAALAGQDFAQFLRDYPRQRGMDFEHDAHDWLGGHPYESIDTPGVNRIMHRLGFRHVHSNVTPRHIGVFGSGCDEYVFERTR
jgi:2-polyprenyl-6-hydroxyphenyl methylase/3-demethylubiquinone-9 3-methyltransferase